MCVQRRERNDGLSDLSTRCGDSVLHRRVSDGEGNKMRGDCNICINGKLPSYSATFVECGLARKNYKPKSNTDSIRAMSDEELAIWLSAIMDCSNCVAEIPCAKEITTKFCKDILCEWLKSPVEVDNG